MEIFKYFDLNYKAPSAVNDELGDIGLHVPEQTKAEPKEVTIDLMEPKEASEEKGTTKSFSFLTTPSYKAKPKIIYKSKAAHHGGPPPPGGVNIVDQILLYLALVIGVFFSNAVLNHKSGTKVSLDLNWTEIIISFVIAIIIMPAVYKNLQVDPSAPRFIKFAMFVGNGITWQTLIGAVGKFTTPVSG